MRRPGLTFTALLLVATLVALARILPLAPGSRLAPLWVVLPTLALLMLQVVLDASHTRRSRLRALREDSLFGTPGRVDQRLDRAGSGDESGRRRIREARMVFWGGTLLGLVYAVGFFWAVPLYLAPYLRAEAGLTWTRATLAASTMAVLLYVAFVWVLELPFPPGVLAS